MSPRVFDGWSPAEVHEHFDVDGNLTGRTVVTREPLWDDSDRGRALALGEYEASLCPCGCGQPLDEAADPKRAFSVESFRCQARRALEKIRRADRETAERVKKPDGWDDGLTYYINDSFPIDPAGGPPSG